MTAPELVEFLSTAGIRLSLNNDDIKLNAPKGKLTPELLTEIKTNKAEIIDELKQRVSASPKCMPSVNSDSQNIGTRQCSDCWNQTAISDSDLLSNDPSSDKETYLESKKADAANIVKKVLAASPDGQEEFWQAMSDRAAKLLAMEHKATTDNLDIGWQALKAAWIEAGGSPALAGNPYCMVVASMFADSSSRIITSGQVIGNAQPARASE